MTKLPMPCPPYPPLTLRYGNMPVLLKLAVHGGPGAATRRSQTLRVAARAFDVILFDGTEGKREMVPSPSAAAGSHRARACAACRLTAPHSRRNLDTGYEQDIPVICQSPMGTETPLILLAVGNRLLVRFFKKNLNFLPLKCPAACLGLPYACVARWSSPHGAHH